MLWVAVINSYYAVNNWILLNRFNFVSTCLYYYCILWAVLLTCFCHRVHGNFEIFLTLYCKCSLVVCKTTYNINSDLCSFVKLPNVIENKNDNLWGVKHSFVVRIDPIVIILQTEKLSFIIRIIELWSFLSANPEPQVQNYTNHPSLYFLKMLMQ